MLKTHVRGARAWGWARALCVPSFLITALLLPQVRTQAQPMPIGKLPIKPVANPRPTPKAVAKPVAKPGATPAKPAPPPAPPACNAGDSILSVMDTETEIKCDEEWNNCVGELQVAARNCTSEFQSLTRVEIYEGARRVQVLEFSPAPIASPNSVWREGIPWTTPAELQIEVFYRPPGQQGGESSSKATVRISNKALAAAKAACTQCQGTWGRYGVNKVESCNCKSGDGGKACMDGEECEGYCMYVRHDGEGRERGICSDTRKLTGCHSIIYKGASKDEPVVPPPRKRPTCVD